MVTKMTPEALNFVKKLGSSSSKAMKSASELIKSDIDKFSTEIVNLILRNKVKLEANWSDYTLSDINMTYEEDMVKVADLLSMYGIRDKLPTLESTDTALIINYQMITKDAFGSVSDIINLIHVTIKGQSEYCVNEWIFLYDE